MQSCCLSFFVYKVPSIYDPKEMCHEIDAVVFVKGDNGNAFIALVQ